MAESSRRRREVLSDELRASVKGFVPFFILVQKREQFYAQLRQLPIDFIPNRSIDWLWSARNIFITVLGTHDYLTPEVRNRSILLSQLGCQDPMAAQLAIWAFNLKDEIRNGDSAKILQEFMEGPQTLSDYPLWELKRD